MVERHHVIIGDGVAGATAAETIIDKNPAADVTIITAEDRPLYNRVLIKEVAKGKVPGEATQIHDEDWYDDHGIDLQLETRVEAVDTDSQVVYTDTGDELTYSKLLVATGGTPRPLPVDNSTADGIYYFWTYDDAQRIQQAAEEAEKGIIIGAGLLGIDLAAVCGAQNIDAKYLMRGNRWWRYGLSADGAKIIHDALGSNNVTSVFETGVERFKTDDDGHVEAVIDTDGETHPVDFVGVAIGLSYNTQLLRGTPVEIDNGITVDEHMQTSVKDVYAAGDITRYLDPYLDDYTQNGAWDSAKEQGRVAALNMVADNQNESFDLISSYSVTHFDFPFLSFGHPTEGDTTCERRYGDQEWRRLAFKDGKLIGGVLIGNIAPQRAFKQLIREQREVEHLQEELLDADFTGLE